MITVNQTPEASEYQMEVYQMRFKKDAIEDMTKFGKTLKSLLIVVDQAKEEDSPYKWIQNDLDEMVVTVYATRFNRMMMFDFFDRFNGHIMGVKPL